MKTILVATVKPFAGAAKQEIEKVASSAGYEVGYLEKYEDEDSLCEAVSSVDAMIVRSDKVTARVVAAAKNLKIVVRAGAGYDNLDFDALKTKNIVAMNTPGQNAGGVAELAVAMLIFMMRNRFEKGTGFEIEGKTLGLHGYGAVAKLFAAKCMALGMKAFAYDPFVSDSDILVAGAVPVHSLEELYSTCDVVSIHVPALPSTVGCVNYELLSKMKRSGRTVVLNTARAEVVDMDGLFKALQNNTALCYATDVIDAGRWDSFSETFGVRVWANRQKIGAQTQESNTRAARAAACQIVDFFEKGITKFQLNK